MLKICYLVCGLMISIIDAGSIDFTKSKPIICFYSGYGNYFPNTAIPILDPHCIPHQCEIITYIEFVISATSEIDCLKDTLKILVSSNIPVLLEVNRYPDIYDWSDVLACDGNPTDAKVLTDFALEFGVKGFILFGIFDNEVDSATSSATVNNTIHYINNLKKDNDLVVGVVLSPFQGPLKSYDFTLLNDVVDFYHMNSIDRNLCDGTIFGNPTSNHASEYISGIDTVVGYLNATKLSIPKMYFVADIKINDEKDVMTSYDKACTGSADKKTWCIPSTKDYYEKAKYLHDKNFGMITIWVDLDDINNACKCGSFIMLSNLIAGYKGEAQIPCASIDCSKP